MEPPLPLSSDDPSERKPIRQETNSRRGEHITSTFYSLSINTWGKIITFKSFNILSSLVAKSVKLMEMSSKNSNTLNNRKIHRKSMQASSKKVLTKKVYITMHYLNLDSSKIAHYHLKPRAL